MNEADPSPINLDELRLLPDWLREEGPPPSKQYAAHQGGDAEDFGPRRGPRTGGFDRGMGGGNGGGNRRREGGRRNGPPPRGGSGRPMREERRPEAAAPVQAAPVRVEFLPDEKCLASITKQIRSTHMAYPLFGLARMFLQEPARHLVQFSLVPGDANASTTLYQLDEDGPITLDRAVLERIAYDTLKDRYYAEQTEQKEPPKGNFTNVARNRLSGTLLGPTNYHGYQPALRSEYEARFSRRMSFEDYRRNIEVVNDPALVERWKEDARTTTSIVTREGEPPAVLQSDTEARAHFRQHYFEKLLRTGTTLKVHGSVARNLPEPAMMQAIRQAHETELRYPAQFVQWLRQGLQNAGLHIFKHRKRVVYVSLARPHPFSADGAVSPNVAAILETVARFPLCTRKLLAEQVLSRLLGTGPQAGAGMVADQAPASPVEVTHIATESSDVKPAQTVPSDEVATESETKINDASPANATPTALASDDPLAKAKVGLAADLRFLVQSGHLIEFHNGTFDLPLPPRPKEQPPTNTPNPNVGVPRSDNVAVKDPVLDATNTDDAERAALTVESVTILTPEASDDSEPAAASSMISGLEQTEAQPESPEPADVPNAPPSALTADPVVIGDAESAHPLSPS